MVDFVRKRLQIFVSLTFTDLIPERQAAVEAILTAGHIPAGMELFTSGDESQMEVIKQWIDESDVYLLILGGRYGSIEPTTGKSYIQLEYEYAVEKNKPLFACVIKDSAIELRVKSHGRGVIEQHEPKKLEAFRELVLGETARFCEDAKDIKIAIGETLSHFARRDELVGWVRPTAQPNMPVLADEIVRLSKENAALRNRLESQQPAALIEGRTFEEVKAVVQERKLLKTLLDVARGGHGISVTLNRNALEELESLKLISGSGGAYRVSFAGLFYLNRYREEKLTKNRPYTSSSEEHTG